jgi:hypothetical protein
MLHVLRKWRCIHAVLLPPSGLTVAAPVSAEALVTGGHQQADAVVGQHTLLHAEALLVLATHDLEDVALQAATGGL